MLYMCTVSRRPRAPTTELEPIMSQGRRWGEVQGPLQGSGLHQSNCCCQLLRTKSTKGELGYVQPAPEMTRQAQLFPVLSPPAVSHGEDK